ncbi:uncharacterized protein [Pagrus major]|uniref:uncharacterized protein n=1 Tax=Pagrus major TaxID=143350 RepID=UPI003CC8570D
MNIILISSLLGVASFVLQGASSKETLKVSVSVWPPGLNIYLGECVLLQCKVESNSSSVWSYRWFRDKPHPPPTPNPRHLVSGDSYSISAVTREDAGSYRCQAERRESNTTPVAFDSQPATLSVSELPPPSLTLVPSSRHFFGGERFSVRCPVSQTNSSGWMLRQFSPGRRVRKRVLYTDRCSPLGSAVSADKSDTCGFTAGSQNSGLYWCEDAERRSNAVSITVSYGPIILKTPAFPVFEGDKVVLYCQYWTGKPNRTTFFKNGAEIVTYNSSSSDTVIKMTIENVTQEDEGLYQCASQDRKMKSPASWLSVRPDRGNVTSADGTAASASGEKDSIRLWETRLVLIGGRWAGKSSSGNTLLGQDRFECGRTRTAQSEVRHKEVMGRKLVVVDAPGWKSSLSLTEIPERDKQTFKLNASKCPPGPHVFLLVIPIDCAFSGEQRRTVEQYMRLLGEQAWRYTMVLFTCGDVLGEKTTEQHIESEGDALKWLIDKCRHRYHVFNNKEKSDSSQVTQLLEKIDEMVWHNNGSYYQVDGQTFNIIEEKQREVAEKAEERRRRAEEQRQHMKTVITESKKSLQKLQMILLGSRGVGKTSVGNTILGIKEPEDGKRTAHSVARQGFVGKTEVTLVDTPGWWKGFPVYDTPEAIKEEVMRSMFLCPPGPHVFLLVIDADASFNAKHLDAVTTHMELLGEEVWRHTVVVFTRGDWLGSNTIEQYIDGEGEAMQSLVERCGNRYHVMDNKNADDGTQVTELLEKITETVAGNNWDHFAPDEKIFLTIEEKRRRVEEGARLRESQVKAKRKALSGSSNELKELRIAMLGQKTSGKSATGNTLLRKDVFATCETMNCQVKKGEVAGRSITVIDTPGWWKKSSHWNQEIDKEMVQGLSESPLGVHAVLLVVPLDLTFGEAQQVALEEHMNLFDASVWKNTMVLFTYGDKLADESIEEHIEREHSALRWLVDKCENKYHVVTNMRKTNMSQVTELFEKIEEMVAGNNGRLFSPDTNIHVRIEEKFRRWQLKHVLKQRVEEEYRRRELELMTGFREILFDLQADSKGNATSIKPKSLIADMTKIKAKGIGLKKKGGKETEDNMDAKISRHIEKLNKDIMTSSDHLSNSMGFILPDCKRPSNQSSAAVDNVLRWLSSMQLTRNVENQLTLNFSQTSGYGSVLPQDNLDLDTEADIPE